MNRERVANIIVIVLLLSGAIVGGTKLVKKKLAKPAEYTFPGEIVRQWAFMDATPGTSRVFPRFTPPRTGAWIAGEVSRLTRTHGLRSLLGDGEFYATMSRDLNFQLVARNEGLQDREVSLVGWNRRFKDIKSNFTITGLATDGTEMPGTIDGLLGLSIPLDIRSELQYARYVNPPDSAVWMQVRFTGDKPVQLIRIRYKGADLDVTDELDLRESAPATTRPATQTAR